MLVINEVLSAETKMIDADAFRRAEFRVTKTAYHPGTNSHARSFPARKAPIGGPQT